MKKIILASVVSTILVGCGGSDGGSSAPTTPPVDDNKPLIPLEPSTPVEPEQPLIPLEPSTPVEPDEPLTPLEPSTPITELFANLVQEPVEKITTFCAHEEIVCKVNEDSEPVLEYRAWHGDNFIFNVFASKVILGTDTSFDDNAYTLDTESGVTEVYTTRGFEYINLDFEQKYFEVNPYYGLNLYVEVKYDSYILEGIQNSTSMDYKVFSKLTGESRTQGASLTMGFLEPEYTNYMMEILKKFSN